MTGRRSGAATAALVLFVLLLVGCSSSPATLDQAATQRAVGRAVASRVKPAVQATTCPAGVRRRDGELTRCTVTLAAGVGRVRVLVRQVDGNGRLTVTLQDAVLSNAKVATDLQVDLAKTFGRPFTATCGRGDRVVAPGKRFRCRADDGNGARQVTVTVKDPAGTVTYDVSP